MTEEQRRALHRFYQLLIIHRVVFKKISLKDPTVDTSFLPDRERDEKKAKEQLLQRQLELQRQKELRGATKTCCQFFSFSESVVDIDFNFFDGTS